MFHLTKGMLLILFQWPLIFNSKHPIISCIANYSHYLRCSLYLSTFPSIILSLFVLYASYLLVFSSDEKEVGDDEGTTQEVESETQSEEQQQQEEEEEEVEAEVEAEEVVQEEEEMETEQGHGAPVETEPQPS